MVHHLPECWTTHASDPEAWCICEELRACQYRISNEWKKFSRDQFEAGYADALHVLARRVESLHWTYRNEAEWLQAQTNGFDPTIIPTDAIVLRSEVIDAIQREQQP
jgi:hypothetical protein